MRRNYSVYIHTNKINGKKYVGLTGVKPEERWRNGRGYNHSTYFYHAIQKYGWDNFEHEIVATKLTPEEASELEKELIAKYQTNDERYGYNLDSGGSRTTHSEETRRKMSESAKGRPRSEETREKLRQAATGNKNSVGHKHTEEAKEKNRQAHLGKTHTLTDESKKKIAYSHKARKEVICVELGMEFFSIGEAARYFHGSQSTVSQALIGKKAKTAFGYHWQYKTTT